MRVARRWKENGGPPLDEYAPYTAHCLLVDVFFHVCVGKKLISPDRPSNRIDIAYLYYTPFAMLFISNDKLHRRTANLFMDGEQHFQFGQELKDDLAKLNAHYWGLPEDVKANGLFQLAARPPDDESFLTTRLWKRFGMNTALAKPFRHDDNSTINDELLRKVKPMTELDGDTAAGPFTHDELHDPDNVAIQRLIPLHRGRWRILPPGVEANDP
jgi:hypothetical protein